MPRNKYNCPAKDLYLHYVLGDILCASVLEGSIFESLQIKQ